MTSQQYKTNYDKIDWSDFKPRERQSPGFFHARSDLPTPMIMHDTPGYLSMASGEWVEGRTARKEDLKRTGCREVDPSEFKPTYRSDRLRKKYSKTKHED